MMPNQYLLVNVIPCKCIYYFRLSNEIYSKILIEWFRLKSELKFLLPDLKRKYFLGKHIILVHLLSN